MTQIEIWKDIIDFEGIYQISSFGRLKSFKKDKNGYILSNINKNGNYFSVVLEAKNKKTRYVRMHILVAETFISPRINNMVVNHKDSNKQNNNVLNLEWVTQKENTNHAIKHNPGIIIPMIYRNQVLASIRIFQYNLNGIFIQSFLNSKQASIKTGVCQRNILQVAQRSEYKPGKTRKQAGGYIWKTN